jgi:hypothetical protein
MNIALKRYGRAIVFGVLLVTLIGCGKEKPKNRKEVFPVHGTVLYQGKPAVGAEVAFHPVGEVSAKALCPSGTVDKDGHFSLCTHEGGDGAPAGEYAVTIVWLSPPPRNMPDEPGPDRLNGRFNNQSRPAWRIQVKSQPNELPLFQLQ